MKLQRTSVRHLCALALFAAPVVAPAAARAQAAPQPAACKGDSVFVGEAKKTMYMIRTNEVDGFNFTGLWKEADSNYEMTLNADGTGVFVLDAPDLRLPVTWYIMGDCDGTVKSLAPDPNIKAYILMMKSSGSDQPMLKGNYPPGTLISKVVHNASGHFSADGMEKQ